jgi:ribonuclease P protein component
VRFTRAARLLRRREFLAVQQGGQRLYAREVVILALDTGRDGPRIGITVPGKVANSVIRNRVKRWVREAFRSSAAGWPAVDLVVVARAGAGDLGLEGVRRALAAARERLGTGGRP